ncbi:MAG: ABC transporter permease [Bacteroidetes bacterium]|nr:ABC transporter permease [Bacteroidota bacterium]MCL2302247.1 ABC transporter permease [Lentimicrobiaceae bacterium]MCL2302327.1 ABC transporter permease [Lentimicrobiaceae bacterium]
MKQFLTFVNKEFMHIWRDKRTILVVIGLPIMQMILFGFAISTEVRNVRFGVFNPSQDAVTLKLEEHFRNNLYFTHVEDITNPNHYVDYFKQDKVDMILVFENNFEYKLVHQGKAHIQILTDGIDPNSSTAIANYANQIIQKFQRENIIQAPTGNIIIPQIRLLYNPQMKSAFNFVPGVMGLILTIICAMMTAVSIVREKERGSMEVLLVSPIKPIYIMISKMLPYLVISVFIMLLIILLSVFMLGVPMAGSYFTFSLVSLVFVIAMLALGLLISTLVENQVIALLISGMGLMMPTALLTGMIFPIDNMPWLLRTISMFLPARWFIAAIRKIMIEGLDFMYIYKEFIILCLMTLALLVVSLKKFKIRLE